MGAEDALKTMECIPKPSAGSGQRHFLTEVKIRAGENMLRIKDLVRAVKRVCGLGRVARRAADARRLRADPRELPRPRD